jgi:hypothetical protein
MNDFGKGFLTGFMDTTARNIGERKDEARDYFNKRMQLAFDNAAIYKTKGREKMTAGIATAKQLKAMGVPDTVIMAVANQNPDDLGGLAETIQKMQLEGVDTSSEDFWNELVPLSQEFSTNGESVEGLLRRIHQPLTNNIKSDPEGFRADPKGGIWATMMGYNAMERANQKLAQTEIMPGMSAADALYGTNLPNSPLGDHAVVLNAEGAHEELESAKGTTIKDADVVRAIGLFNDYYDEELELAGREDLPQGDRIRIARKRAASRVYEDLPDTVPYVPNITKWLSDDEGTGATEPGTVPAPQSPTEGATAAPQSQATTLPEGASEPPQQLPDGSTFEKALPNGNYGYRTATGQAIQYTPAYVQSIMRGQEVMKQDPGNTMRNPDPQSGWMDKKFGG